MRRKGASCSTYPPVSICSLAAMIHNRKVTRTASQAYRMWMAHNLTGGYGSYFEPEERALTTASITIL